MRAIISVSDKQRLIPFAQALSHLNIELLASGGTASALRDAGVPVRSVEDFTGHKEILDGRVKTLHPKIHAGILADRNNPAHMETVGNDTIELVVCNFYPSEIDIGGPCLVRAAAKNHEHVLVVCDPLDYDVVSEALREASPLPPRGGGLGWGANVSSMRRRLAAKAFALVARYDATIAHSFEEQPTQPLLGEFVFSHDLRYGENPHQQGALFVGTSDTGGVGQAQLLQGSALSYNNYLDMDSAWRLVAPLKEPACAIIKHTNPCGLATSLAQPDAFWLALGGDRTSAFGGVLAFNAELQERTAAALVESRLFAECLVAPAYAESALALLSQKTKLRVVRAPLGPASPALHMHRIGGGMLVQEPESLAWDPVTFRSVTRAPVPAGLEASIELALRAVWALRSNAIAIVKDQTLVGAGCGTTSRVDAVRLAIEKAQAQARGAVVASDAFFPFPDSIALLADAEVALVVQPGGSKQDEAVIAACNERGLPMLFTGQRLFRH